MKNILIAILGVALVVSLFVFRPKPQPLGGALHAQFGQEVVTNSSSSLSVSGETIITAAQNAGVWFRITNTSAASVYCAPANTTSAIGTLPSGVLLTSVASSTANSFWEAEGIGGPISCLPSATAVITFSFVDKTKF